MVVLTAVVSRHGAFNQYNTHAAVGHVILVQSPA